MILLPINKEIVHKLFEHHITSDYIGSTLIVLYSLYHNNYTLLDELDKENNDIMFLRIYKDLEIKNIVRKTDDTCINLFELTELGISLIRDIETVLQRKETSIVSKKLLVNSDFISEWLDLWKNDKKVFIRSNGYSLGCSKKDAEVKMNGFLKNYSYIFESLEENEIFNIIFAVTKNYLKEQKDNGYMYTRKCSNFISKVENHTKDSKVSELAMKCEEYITQQINNSFNDTTRKVNLYNTSIN